MRSQKVDTNLKRSSGDDHNRRVEILQNPSGAVRGAELGGGEAQPSQPQGGRRMVPRSVLTLTASGLSGGRETSETTGSLFDRSFFLPWCR